MGFLKPKMPPMPDPVETYKAQEAARDEVEAEKQAKLREDAAKDSIAEEKRKAQKRAARRSLVQTGDGVLGVDQSFIGNRRTLI